MKTLFKGMASFLPIVLLIGMIYPANTQVQKKYIKASGEEMVQSQKIQNMSYKKAPQSTIDMFRNLAQPFSEDEKIILKSVSLPSFVDYSSKVTLIRDQNPTSQCAEYSAAALVDLIKEIERPYTPDVSEGFINYCYQAGIGWYPSDSRFSFPGEGQMGVVKYLGVVPETYLSSRNYDPNNLGRTPTAQEIPADIDLQIAPLLKVKDIKIRTFNQNEGIDEIKALLCSGPVGILSDGHCMALIGYDDSKSQFTFQNSYAERGANRGFVIWTYNDMLNNMHKITNNRPDLSATIVTNDPTPTNAYVYTARIKAKTPVGRNDLTLKVGVEGLMPITLWSPSPYGATDQGQALTFDVPLPDYAAQHWPPNESHQWFLEASYGSNNGGVIEDVVLVKRGFKSDGTPLSTLFRSSASSFRITPNNSEIIYIPSKISKQLILSANPVNVDQAKRVTLSCTLLTHIASSTTSKTIVPGKNIVVEIWEIKSDPIEQIIKEKQIGLCTTDSEGKCSLTFSSEASAQYQAYALDTEGIANVSSNIISVNVNKSIRPTKVVKPGLAPKGPPYIYAVTADGNLNWYKHTGYQNGTSDMQGPITIGFEGWNGFKSVFVSSDVIYAITKDGNLCWYKHVGQQNGTKEMQGAITIGFGGWNGYNSVFVSGNILYAISKQGDLLWYHHKGYQNGTTEMEGAKTIAKGGWNAYKSVFGFGNIIYAITRNGDLLWYRHIGYYAGSPEMQGPVTIGFTGWQEYKSVFCGGEGIIYAISKDGNLYYYKHTGFQTGSTKMIGPILIGQTGWQDYLFVTSSQ